MITALLIVIALNQAVGLWLNLYQFSPRARRRKAETDAATKLWIDHMLQTEARVWVKGEAVVCKESDSRKPRKGEK